MSDESYWINLITQFAMALPSLLVCVISLIVILMRRLPKKTKRAATLGMSLLTVDVLASTAFRLYINSQAYSGSYDDGMFRIIQQTYGIATTLLYVAGIIFLLIAICVKESPDIEKQIEQNPYAE